LILAELGFETADAMSQAFPLPAWAIREVSDDIRFTGGALATLAPEQARQLLEEIRLSHSL
jgi:hypothetical protein